MTFMAAFAAMLARAGFKESGATDHGPAYVKFLHEPWRVDILQDGDDPSGPVWSVEAWKDFGADVIVPAFVVTDLHATDALQVGDQAAKLLLHLAPAVTA